MPNNTQVCSVTADRIANSYQISGSDYQMQYQPWDFIVDIKLPYLLGCAVRYLSHWRDNKGIEDLERSVHYLEKFNEGTDLYYGNVHFAELILRYTKQFCAFDKHVITLICSPSHTNVIAHIKGLIKALEDSA